MTLRLLLVPLLCVSACTAKAPEQRAATPTPTAVTHTLQLAVPGNDVQGHGVVNVYRVDEARQAHLLRRISSPGWSSAIASVQLGEGEEPPLCVLFTTNADVRAEAHCYPSGAAAPWVLPLSGASAMAMSADGQSLVWMTDPSKPGAVLEKASLAGGELTSQGSTPLQRLQDDLGAQCPEGIRDVAWARGRDVVIQCSDNGWKWPVVLRDVDAVLKGSAVSGMTALRPRGPLAAGYDRLTVVTPLDAGTALAQLSKKVTCREGGCTPESPPPDKAVLISLPSGRVLSEVATTAPGRSFTALGGGARGLMYVTQGQRAYAVYVRWPGEKHGKRVSGLVGGFGVVAQR